MTLLSNVTMKLCVLVGDCNSGSIGHQFALFNVIMLRFFVLCICPGMLVAEVARMLVFLSTSLLLLQTKRRTTV